MKPKVLFAICVCVAFAGLTFLKAPPSTNAVEASKTLPEAKRQPVRVNYARLPLSFEANHGQTDRRVKFLSRGSGYTLFLTPTEGVLALAAPVKPKPSANYSGPLPPALARLRFPDEAPGVNGQRSLFGRAMTSEGAAPPWVLRIRLVGANPKPKIEALDALPGKSNHFIGNDPKKWRTNVPTYAKVKYDGVFPGVDLVYYGNQRELEYDFTVSPGADPRAITLGFEGTERIRINEQGDLVVSSKEGDVRLKSRWSIRRRGASDRRSAADTD